MLSQMTCLTLTHGASENDKLHVLACRPLLVLDDWMTLFASPDLWSIFVVLLQMCIGKETSWQAKEGAVMCKSLELYIFVILTSYSLYTDHPLFIIFLNVLLVVIFIHCKSKIAFYFVRILN